MKHVFYAYVDMYNDPRNMQICTFSNYNVISICIVIIGFWRNLHFRFQLFLLNLDTNCIYNHFFNVDDTEISFLNYRILKSRL